MSSQKVDPAETLLRSFFGPAVPENRYFDVERMAYWLCAVNSAEFFIKNFPLAPNLVNSPALLDHAMLACTIDGLNLEFGVFSGTSITRLANTMQQVVHGFDSFEGLPEDWTHIQKAARYSRNGQLPPVPDTVVLHKGWFEDTLPTFVAEYAGPVRFLHVDSDLYSSAQTIFTYLGDRIVPGTVIVFDEYFNYPGWEYHEHKAWSEFVAFRNIKFEYIGWASAANSLSVKVTAR